MQRHYLVTDFQYLFCTFHGSFYLSIRPKLLKAWLALTSINQYIRNILVSILLKQWLACHALCPGGGYCHIWAIYRYVLP